MNVRILCLSVLTTLIFTLPACTSLNSYKLNQHSEIPPGAFPYTLNKTRLIASFNVTLQSCDGIPNKNNKGVLLNLSVTPSQVYGPDESERYYIDYKKLSGFLKTTSLKISANADQTLQSINAETNDQTLQVLGAGLQATAQIVGAVSIGGVNVKSINPSDAASYAFLTIKETGPQTGQICSDETIKNLKNLETANNKLIDAIKASKANNNSTDPNVTLATNDVAKATKPLTVSIPVTIEPKISDFLDGLTSDDLKEATYPVQLSSYIKYWFKSQSMDNTWSINGIDQLSSNTPILIKLSIPTWAAISNVMSSPVADPDQNSLTLIDGLVVRQPALGTMRICIENCSPPDEFGVFKKSTSGNNYDLINPIVISIPQIGKKLILPLHNQIGTDNSISLTLSQDGSIASFSFSNNTNIANGLTSIGSAANAYTTGVTAENTAITARNTAITSENSNAVAKAQYADTVLKAQSDCMLQQAAVIKAGGKPLINCN